ncbi:unnamed protein product [marine sediment metagenome]|uniref:Uncharacterized protein n=1 Tax=marine sediment metagenome TaxID=412755 RepID=X0TMV9_9ZZZZ
MKSVFVNTGLDDHLADKIEKGQIYNNVQESLPTQKVAVTTLYRALRKGESLLKGFKLPDQADEELRKALITIAQVIEVEENKRQEPVVTEAELLEALDFLDETARDQRQ